MKSKKKLILLSFILISNIDIVAAAVNTTATRFTAENETVIDEVTGLRWQRCSVGLTWRKDNKCIGKARKLDFSQSQRFHSFTTGSSSTWAKEKAVWRVPTKKEIESLIDKTQPAFNIDRQIFPDVDPENSEFWTSDMYGDGQAWYANFEHGLVSYMYGDYVNAFEKMNLRLVHLEK